MKKENNLAAGISEPEVVDAFISQLKHPLSDLVKKTRSVVLSADKKIGEGIFWNAPTFYYTGKMAPFDPKEYKRYIAGMNFYKQDTIRLIFLKGAGAADPSGIFEGDYKDGRRIISFKSIEDLDEKTGALKKIVSQLIGRMG